MADKRTRYVAPDLIPRSGTARRDPATGNLLHGEVNQSGQPMGTRPAAAPSAITTFRAGAGTPGLDSLRALNRPVTAPVTAAPAPRVVGPPRDYGVAGATAATAGAFNAQPFGMSDQPKPAPTAPASSPPAAAPTTAPRIVSPALPRNPDGTVNKDDLALLMATRAKDAAARAPEPISIPGGLTGHAMRPGEKPWSPGGDFTEGNALTAAVNRANGVVPQLASNPRLDAEAVRGTVRYVPKGTPEAAAVVSNTGVTRHPATIAPRLAAPPSVPPAGDGSYIDQQNAFARSAAPPVPSSAPAPTPPVPDTSADWGRGAPPPAKPSLIGDWGRGDTAPTGTTRGPWPDFNALRSASSALPRPPAAPSLALPPTPPPADWGKPSSTDPLSGGFDSAPQLIRPRKRATPLDEPANQYA